LSSNDLLPETTSGFVEQCPPDGTTPDAPSAPSQQTRTLAETFPAESDFCPEFFHFLLFEFVPVKSLQKTTAFISHIQHRSHDDRFTIPLCRPARRLCPDKVV
jgi:hypothetical protein